MNQEYGSAELLFGFSQCYITDFSEVIKDGHTCKQFSIEYKGFLPDICPKCGKRLYKHGARTISILDTPFGGEPTEILLLYPRKHCKDCGYTWKPTFQNIDEKHNMTNRAVKDITHKALHLTFKDASDGYLLNERTVQRVFVDWIREQEKAFRFKTPHFLGLDEIIDKKLKELTVITDLEHHTLYDILQGRNQAALTAYFEKIPETDRMDIDWVCTDMYRPFEKSIKTAFPNARWTIDHFHIVMKANEALDDVRRKLQTPLPKELRLLTKKKLAYTLKKRTKDLNAIEASRIRTLREIPDFEPLIQAYDLKEEFFEIFDIGRYGKEEAAEAFDAWTMKLPMDNPLYEKYVTLGKTVHNFYEEIFQTWDCPIAISNAFTEATNRVIREMSLRGRGYSFEVLRGRALYRDTNFDRLKSYDLLGPSIDDSTEDEEVDEEGNDMSI